MDSIPNGLIRVDSPAGKLFGFTSDTFKGDGQLFRKDDTMYVVSIEVLPEHRRQGHLNCLLNKFWDFNFIVKVPNPMSRMYGILKRKGFSEISEDSITTPGTLDVVMVMNPP